VDPQQWDERYRARELVWPAEPNRWVVEEVRGLTPGRALDLACGEGRNSLWLAGEGWDVTGVDFSAVALERAARLAAQRGDSVVRRVHWIQADVTTYEPQPGSQDLVVISYLHLPPPGRGQVFRRAARALRPGGHLVVVGHDLQNLTHGSGGPSDPAVLFTADDVLADVLGTSWGGAKDGQNGKDDKDDKDGAAGPAEGAGQAGETGEAGPAVEDLQVVRAQAVHRPTEGGTAIDALVHLRRG